MRPALLPFRYRLRSLSIPICQRLSTISQRQQFHTPRLLQQQQQQYEAEIRPNFYRSHGRAFFKAITLAFLTYQVVYWAWLTLETEDLKYEKNNEIKALEDEVRLLDEGRKGQGSADSSAGPVGSENDKR